MDRQRFDGANSGAGTAADDVVLQTFALPPISFARGFLRVTRGTERLQVLCIPEQMQLAFMRHDVIELKVYQHAPTGGAGIGGFSQDAMAQELVSLGLAGTVVEAGTSGVLSGIGLLARMLWTVASVDQTGTARLHAVLHGTLHLQRFPQW
jgi:hypothetical protein